MFYHTFPPQENSIKVFFVIAVRQITLIKMPHKYASTNQPKQSSLKQSRLALFDSQIKTIVKISSCLSSLIQMLNTTPGCVFLQLWLRSLKKHKSILSE